jgi:NADH-quinone oxidoreductase subunit J
VTARNPVHAVLYLMLTFSQASGLWFLLNAEFLAITLVLVYLGAVMVLFLFVVMMLDINMDTLRAGFWKHFPLAATLGAVVAFEMGAVLMSGFRLAAPAAVDAASQANNAKALGVLLYTDYLMPIQIAAAILLVAMMAAIALTLRHRKDSKAIDPSIQVRVKARDRVSMVQVSVTQPAPAPVVEQAPAEEKKA